MYYKVKILSLNSWHISVYDGFRSPEIADDFMKRHLEIFGSQFTGEVLEDPDYENPEEIKNALQPPCM